MASACGSRVSDEQAAIELREDAFRTGGLGPAAGGLDGEFGADGELGAQPGAAAGAGTGPGVAGTGGEAATTGEASPAARGESVGGATDTGVTATEIRLGNVSTLTGPVPGLFRGALIGTQAFAAYQNSQGGLFGRQLRVLSGDDTLDSGRNRAAHLELRDRVLAFVGSFSVADDGGARILEECNCPDVGGALSKARFNLPNQFSPQPVPPGWRSGPPTWFANRFPSEVTQNWALFVAAIESARDIARDMRAVYEQVGFRVVYTREVQTNEQNFTGDVIQMQRQGVRALSYQGDVGNMARLARDMRQQNFTVDMANWGNGIYDPNAFTIAGEEALEGALIDQVYALFQGEDAQRIPEVALFNQWMQRIDPNQPVDLFALFGWLSGRLFVEAMQKAASPTRANLLESLSTITRWDGNGMVGPVDPAGKRASDCFFIFTINNGNYRRVFPPGDRNFACDVAPYVYR